ncbi:MAG TPA: hypothetical protein QGG37_04690 [Chloroflexota bacterium]|nr:hypothetical protein [Chloroflexota bacterium]
MRRWPLVLAFMVAVFAASAGDALWSMADHGTPESPVVSPSHHPPPNSQQRSPPHPKVDSVTISTHHHSSPGRHQGRRA